MKSPTQGPRAAPPVADPRLGLAVVAWYTLLVVIGTKVALASDLVDRGGDLALWRQLPAALAPDLLVVAGVMLFSHLLLRSLGAKWSASVGGAVLGIFGVLQAVSVVYARVEKAPLTVAALLAPGGPLEPALLGEQDRVALVLLLGVAGGLLPALIATAARSARLLQAAHPAFPALLALAGIALLLLGRAAPEAPALLCESPLLALARSAGPLL
jgi:hypothetical protein